VESGFWSRGTTPSGPEEDGSAEPAEENGKDET